MSIAIQFNKTHLKVANVNYFVTNAPGIEIGSWGEKKSPITQPNYLMLEGRVAAGKLKIRTTLDLTIDSATLNESGLAGGLTVAGLGKLSAGASVSKLRTQEVRLMKLEVLPADLAKAANESPAVIEGFRRVGNDGRLVHQIIVAVDAKSAETIGRAASVSAEVEAGIFKLVVGAGTGSTSTTRISFENCTLAYLLLKPKWDASQKKNWERIVDWDDDRWSLS